MRLYVSFTLLFFLQLIGRPTLAQHGPGEHNGVEVLPPIVDVAPVTPEMDTGRESVSLADLEARALANNPTIVQANAQIRAARGGTYQAGRWFNPMVGYTSDQIGVNGTAGELQGGFVSQEFVTGGKLRLSREKWAQRARIAETNLSAQHDRVLNDVRVLFYRALGAQQHVEVQGRLLENARDNVLTHKEMLNLGQTNQAGILQAEVDLQRHRLNLQSAENELRQSWRNLVAMIGAPQLQPAKLSGSLETDAEPLDWESAIHRLLNKSPELIAAWEKVRHDEITVERERVEPIPNLTVGASVGRNFETGDTVIGVTAGIPLPIFDKNRGTVQQALADLDRSRVNVKRLELKLSTRLAAHYRHYFTAWQHAEAYRTEMLPKSKKAYDLLHESYKARRAAWPDVLMARRMYLDLQLQYINHLVTYRETDVAIRGMLLSGGLTEPPAPISGGHIDAVPKPR